MWPFDISKKRRDILKGSYGKIRIHTQHKGKLKYEIDLQTTKARDLVALIEFNRNGKRPKLFRQLESEVGDEVVKILYQRHRREKYFVNNPNLEIVSPTKPETRDRIKTYK